MEFNEESQQWEFFYEGIRGFDFEPGFIYRLKVSLHERDGGIQDVGRYEYRLVEVLSKEEASVDEDRRENRQQNRQNLVTTSRNSDESSALVNFTTVRNGNLFSLSIESVEDTIMFSNS